MTYLFLIKKDNRWIATSRDGKVVVTDNAMHFGGKMPRVEVEEIFLATVPTDNVNSVEQMGDVE